MMKPFTLTILGWLTLLICHAQPKEFEGIVRYSFRAIPKAEGLTVEDLRNMLLQDDSVICYVRNGQMKWDDGRKQRWFVPGEKRIYYRYQGVDTLYYTLYDNNETMPVEAESLNDTKTIAGHVCNAMAMTSWRWTKTYYYTPELYMNPKPNESIQRDGYGLFLHKTEAIWLRLEEKYPAYDLVAEASGYESRALADELFALPDLPKAPMRSSTVYRRPVYGTGHHDWVRYLRENTYSEGPEDGPIALDEEVDWTSERVLVCFMVDKTGLVSWAKIMNKVKIPRDISKEVLRVLRYSPRWSPGYVAGKAVPYFLIQPFNVILPD